MPADVSNYVVESYVKMRRASKSDDEKDKGRTYTSARTLLGILRLAQSLARLRLAEEVAQNDVDEALRLMECSKASLLDDDDDRDIDTDRSTASKIFRLMKSMADIGAPKPNRRRGPAESGRGLREVQDMDVDEEDEDGEILSLVDVRARILQAGFTEQQLQDTISEVGYRYLLFYHLLTSSSSMREWAH